MPSEIPQQLDDEIGPEERDALVDALAKKIVARGLETAAVLFLEMNKPISFLAGQTMIAASPFLIPLFGRHGVDRYSRLLSEPGSVELIIRRIEELADEKDTEKGKK